MRYFGSFEYQIYYQSLADSLCRIGTDTLSWRYNTDCCRKTKLMLLLMIPTVSGIPFLRFRIGDRQQLLHSRPWRLNFLISPSDPTAVRIVVSDKFGRPTASSFIKFPWLEDDTSVNHDYRNALNGFIPVHHWSLVMELCTVKLPLLNSGNDSMYITTEFRNDMKMAFCPLSGQQIYCLL